MRVCDFLHSQDFQGLRQVEHLSDGWRLFHVPSAECMGQSGELSAETRAVRSAPDAENFRFALDGRVVETQIEATSAKRIAKAPFFVRAEHDEWNRDGSNRSELWYGNLPCTEDLEQQRLKTLIDLVEFIDKQ